MVGQLPRARRPSAADASFYAFLAAVVVCLLRANDLPALTFGVTGTDVSVGLSDLLLLVVTVLAILRLRERVSAPSWPILGLAAAFGVLILASAIPNGADAVTSAGKVVTFGALTLGGAVFLDRYSRLTTLLGVLVAFCTVATAWGVVQFLRNERERQASFLGEHDLAALGTLAVVVGLAYLFARGRAPALAVVALVAGSLAIVLGAAVASLLGLYLAAVALFAVAAVRRQLRPVAVAATALLCVLVTAGTVALRGGDLGFLQAWFGPPPETPGQYAASWSQRLIYVYVGGRVFLDQPVLGTGWHGELPPSEYSEYLPAARDRFPDQPPHYFPQQDGTLIPQQTYDQLLFELGLVGLAVFLVLAGLTVRRAWKTAATTPRDGAWAEQAYIPIGFVAAVAGALAGAALFGGSPLTAIFWLLLGLVAAERVRP